MPRLRFAMDAAPSAGLTGEAMLLHRTFNSLTLKPFNSYILDILHMFAKLFCIVEKKLGKNLVGSQNISKKMFTLLITSALFVGP